MIGSDPVSTEISSSTLANDALFSVAPPPLSPEHLNASSAFGDDVENFEATEAAPAYPKASWLDAIPFIEEPFNDELDGLTAVNSDDNGLYRLFIGVSP